jgi:tetrahydromethanopterin S-methyltransferase subunit G
MNSQILTDAKRAKESEYFNPAPIVIINTSDFMTDDSRFDDIYDRLNDLTMDVANLKIKASTIPTLQQGVSTLLTLTTGLASEFREMNSRLRALEANSRNTDASINEILRLLRERNSDNPQA